MTYAQNNEEKIIEDIFKEIGTTNKFAVEFGCHPNHQFSNGKALEEKGWTVHFYGVEGGEDIKQEFFTAENINEIFDKYEVPQSPDLMSIDVDGMDYYLWKALKRKPRVVIIEYNIRRPKGIQPYFSLNVWNRLNDNYFGACKEEMIKLGKEKGYELVGENEANLFFKLYEKSTGNGN